MLFRSALILDLRSAKFGTSRKQPCPIGLDMTEYADRQGVDNVVVAIAGDTGAGRSSRNGAMTMPK